MVKRLLLAAIFDGAIFADVNRGRSAYTERDVSSTNTLFKPFGEDEITAWMDAGQLRFRVVVLNLFAWAPYPVPWVDGLTLTGLKSWMAFWAEATEAVTAKHTAARPARKLELFMDVLTPIPFLAIRLGAQVEHTTATETNVMDQGGGVQNYYKSLRDCAISRVFCQLKLSAGFFSTCKRDSSVSCSALRSAGNRTLQIPVIASAPMPPATTARTAPHHWAVTPLSNSPSSLEAPTKSEFTALTLPLMEAGVANCSIDERITTLIMSEAPTAMRAPRDKGKLREMPKTMVAQP